LFRKNKKLVYEKYINNRRRWFYRFSPSEIIGK
jgi:hypothetical protein